MPTLTCVQTLLQKAILENKRIPESALKLQHLDQVKACLQNLDATLAHHDVLVATYQNHPSPNTAKDLRETQPITSAAFRHTLEALLKLASLYNVDMNKALEYLHKEHTLLLPQNPNSSQTGRVKKQPKTQKNDENTIQKPPARNPASRSRLANHKRRRRLQKLQGNPSSHTSTLP